MAVIVLIVSLGILGAITLLVLHRKGKTPPVSNRDPSPYKTILVLTCIINSYMICFWVGGKNYAQRISHSTVF